MTGTTVFTAERIFDGHSTQLIPDGSVAVQNGRVAAVGGAATIHRDFPGATRIAVAGTLLPGLIDMHVHLCLDGGANPAASILRATEPELVLRAVPHLRATLLAGVTTVRDLGSPGRANIELAKAVERGDIAGPRVIPAGPVLCVTGGHAHFIGRECDGPASFTHAARDNLKAGAQLLKIIATGGVITPGVEAGAPQMGLDEIRAVTEVARRAQKRVASHAQGEEGILLSLQGGCHTVEHGFRIDAACLAAFRARPDAWLVPTFAAGEGILAGEGRGTPDWLIAKYRAVAGDHTTSVRRAHAAGIPIVAGTDAGTPFNPHGGLAREIELLAAHGLEPWEALAAATSRAADALGRPDLGRIAPGACADFVAVRGNPLENLGALKKPELVVCGGRVVHVLS